MNDILYHYCSLNSFFNIIQSDTLRLFDISKSNDSKECKWIANSFFENLTLSNESYKDSIYQLIESQIEKLGIYAICFSDNGDLLSQWRGYAQDGNGIAIGFSMDCLKSFQHKYYAKFGRIIYKEVQQKAFLKRLNDMYFPKVSNRIALGVIADFFGKYKLEIPFYKNPSFEEEHEWRVVVADDKGSPKSYQKNLSHAIGKCSFSKVKYSTDGKKLISYIEVDFSRIKREFVREIHIGPKSSVSKQDIVDFLSYNDYYELGESYSEKSPIKIEYSKSTYR